MRVWVVTANRRGGLYQYSVLFCNALKLAGIESTLVRPIPPETHGISEAGIRALDLASASRRIVDHEIPDVVHFQSYNWRFARLHRSLRVRGVPQITTAHDGLGHLGERAPDRVLARTLGYTSSVALIAHGRRTYDLLRARYPKKTLAIIPHGNYSFVKGMIGSRGAEPYGVLYFGRMTKYKGLAMLARVFTGLRAIHPDLPLTAAGEGEIPREVMAELAAARVTVINHFLPLTDVAKLFSDAQVVLLPYEEASQSGVAVMAASVGRPVVASAVGDVPELVIHDKTGFLIAPGDVQSFIRSTSNVVLDRNLGHELGRAAEAMADRELAWDGVASRTILVYERVVA